MKAFKAVIKPFEAPEGSTKIKTQVNFFTSFGIGMGEVKHFLRGLKAPFTFFFLLLFQV